MKRYIICLLSFMLFFSSIDLSCVSMLKNIYTDNSKISISDIISVQYEIFEQTKQAFSEICNNIMKDINIFLTSTKSIKSFIDLYNFFVNKDYLNYCVLLAVPIVKKIININFYNGNNKISLFFFVYIYLFMLKYLGLLFTFGKKATFQRYKKAYSI